MNEHGSNSVITVTVVNPMENSEDEATSKQFRES